MTYEETKQYGAHSIINTTFYGCGHYIVNDREKNDATVFHRGRSSTAY